MNASRYIFAFVTLSAALAVACSDDTSSTSNNTTSSGEGGGTTSSSGEGGSNATTGGGSSQGGMGQGGEGEGGGGLATEAKLFCKVYGETCGFAADGPGFTSAEDCLGDYLNKFSPARRECVNTHLDLAKENAMTHCPHAAGNGPCAGD